MKNQKGMEKVLLEIGQSAAKLLSIFVLLFFSKKKKKNKTKIWRKFNDCKARHASGIYSLAPRETVPRV